jgi:hypothetical protein
MKKAVRAFAFLIATGVAGWFVFQTIPAKSGPEDAITEVSAKTAAGLQTKIDRIKQVRDQTKAQPNRNKTPETITVYEAELESYVLYALREDIPVQLDSFDVQLSPGSVAADTQVTFNQSTGNPMVDSMVGGTHNLFLRGRLSATQGVGKFDLEEIRIDGIPVPRVLIETLFKKYVQPKYPDADLKEPFDLPWDIRELTIQQGKATIVY